MRLKLKKLLIFNQRGINLVELLISALLTIIIGAAVLEFYVTQHNQFIVQEDISDMQQNGRVAMDEIAKNIRRAGYGLTGHPSIVVGSDTLKIYFSNGAQIDSIVYYISRAVTSHPNLMRKVSSDIPRVFAENIDSLRFTQSGKLINVRIVAREDKKDQGFVGDKYRRRIFSSNVKMRNNL